MAVNAAAPANLACNAAFGPRNVSHSGISDLKIGVCKHWCLSKLVSRKTDVSQNWYPSILVYLKVVVSQHRRALVPRKGTPHVALHGHACA